MVEPARGARRLLYWILAGLFFVLAMVGVALPGLPTTPLLLLMCYFLMRVSPSLHAKPMAWPVVGGPLRDWQDHGGVRPRVKLLACSMVVTLVGSTLVWAAFSQTLKAIIFCTALYGISIVIRLPTATSATKGSTPSPGKLMASTVPNPSNTLASELTP